MKVQWLVLGLVLTAFSACTSTPSTPPSTSSELAPAPAAIRSEKIQANGISFHVLSKGKGPLILFLHGFPEYSGMWNPLLDEFGKDFHAVAPDLRGYNLSDKPQGVDQYTISVLTQDIVALIKALGHEKATLVAHDWGGIVAWFAVDRYPEMFDRLIILNSPHPKIYSKLFRSDPEQKKKAQYVYTFIKPDAEKILSAKDFGALQKAVFESAKKPYSEKEKAAYLEAWGRGLTGPLNFYRAFTPRMDQEIKTMRTIQVPTLVLWGEQDQALSSNNLKGLNALVPRLTLQRFAEASHWIVHEIPEKLIPPMRAFLEAQ